MSLTISYFFNFEQDLKETCSMLNSCLGCSLTNLSDDLNFFTCSFMSMELYFGTHSFDNDSDCDFENYKYEIGLKTYWHQSVFRQNQVQISSAIAFNLFYCLDITDGLLIYNLGIPLARYKSVDSSLFDIFSNSVVSYPKHIVDLYERLPKS
jgi:hypothetical protein